MNRDLSTGSLADDLALGLAVRAPIVWSTPPSLARTLLRAMFTGPPPRAKTIDEARWEDDGGPLVVACEGYEHTIGPGQ